MEKSQLLESSAPESVMLGDYQLALKMFMNKDIPRSFASMRKLQPAAFRGFSRDLISEDLFVKITTLYLTEVGLLLKPQASENNLQMGKNERQELIDVLKKNTILDQISDVYGSVADASSELLYHVFLVYYTCQDVIQAENEKFVLEKFNMTYHALEFHNREDDRHLKRWFDMFVLNVLPDAGDFTTAFAIAEINKTFGGPSTVAKLKKVQEAKTQQKQTEEKSQKEAKAREAKRLAAEKEKAAKEAKERNLKYRSMKQIRAEQESRDTARLAKTPGDSRDSAPTVQTVRDRLVHFYHLSRNTLHQNSPMILSVIIIFLLAGSFLRGRKLNLKQKLKDTLSMAFKVTYL